MGRSFSEVGRNSLQPAGHASLGGKHCCLCQEAAAYGAGLAKQPGLEPVHLAQALCLMHVKWKRLNGAKILTNCLRPISIQGNAVT